MNYKQRIIDIGNENNGYITRKQVEEANIPTVYLTKLVNEGIIDRLEKGIYLLEGYDEDQLYTLSLLYSKIVYSRRTALFLHDMTERLMDKLEVNLPRSYNSGNMQEVILPFNVTGKKYNVGIVEVETSYGNKVRTYSRERCICDFFLRKKVDFEEMKFAINEYINVVNDMSELLSMAKNFNIEQEVRNVIKELQI